MPTRFVASASNMGRLLSVIGGCALGLVLSALPVIALAGDLNSPVVYRCPGSKVLYTDAIDADEAAKRGCTPLRDKPEAAPRPERAASPSKSAPSSPATRRAGFFRPAASGNWVPIGGSGDGCAYYYDPTTRSAKDRYRKAWFMQSCDDAKRLGEGASNKNLSVKFLMYFDCAERASALIQKTLYREEVGQGEVGGSYQQPVQESAFSEVVPGTMGSSWLSIVCVASVPGK